MGTDRAVLDRLHPCSPDIMDVADREMLYVWTVHHQFSSVLLHSSLRIALANTYKPLLTGARAPSTNPHRHIHHQSKVHTPTVFDNLAHTFETMPASQASTSTSMTSTAKSSRPLLERKVSEKGHLMGSGRTVSDELNREIEQLEAQVLKEDSEAASKRVRGSKPAKRSSAPLLISAGVRTAADGREPQSLFRLKAEETIHIMGGDRPSAFGGFDVEKTKASFPFITVDNHLR